MDVKASLHFKMIKSLKKQAFNEEVLSCDEDSDEACCRIKQFTDRLFFLYEDTKTSVYKITDLVNF